MFRIRPLAVVGQPVATVLRVIRTKAIKPHLTGTALATVDINRMDVTVYSSPQGLFVVNWVSGASGTMDDPSKLPAYVAFLSTQPRDIVEDNGPQICGADIVTEQFAISRAGSAQYHWRGATFVRSSKRAQRINFRAGTGFYGWFDYVPDFGVERFSMGPRTYKYSYGRPLLKGCD